MTTSSSTSMTMFSLSYLGNSIIQKSNDCELETIYELLIDYYLKFLQQVSAFTASSINNSEVVSYKTILTNNYDNVILAIGNGHVLIKSLDYKEHNKKDARLKKTSGSMPIDENFSASELTYFNCYYFEVVTPVGSNSMTNTNNMNNQNRKHDICYAYFRRIIDTRRCIPEDALIRLDSQITNWLLCNRTVTRPPLIYFMVPRLTSNGVNCLACYVFLAESVQIGLKILRCFSELRKSHLETKFMPSRQCKYDKSKPLQNKIIHSKSKNASDKLNENQFECQTESLNNIKHHCEYHQRNSGCQESPLLSPRATKSHIDLLHRFNYPSISQTSMNIMCPQCNLKCCPIHSSLCELHRSKLIQMKLGNEAMDYYYNNHSKYHNKCMKPFDMPRPNISIRDSSVPARLEHKMNHLRIDPCVKLCPLCQHSVKTDCEKSEHFSRNRYQNKIDERTRSGYRYYRSCSPSRYINTKPRDKTNYYHAHLGGSLELIP
ncbi:unnamed protein product [Heterobilharzia americana]|nr:unnamed protein product [Heterobilharzia americana]